ncbi:hypothetical protein Scep_017119 [Stephania cephalantha]|uniref:Uncharacterized protein n=1 Tax=Stephania cephalantha TaxID=152367 RepID=A0AAP0IQQ7_9MAGN
MRRRRASAERRTALGSGALVKRSGGDRRAGRSRDEWQRPRHGGAYLHPGAKELTMAAGGGDTPAAHDKAKLGPAAQALTSAQRQAQEIRAHAATAARLRGERRGATARWRVAGLIDPRRDNNSGQGVVTSTKLDDAMDSNGF